MLVCLIDGFNLYHAINDDVGCNACKWLDLRLLCERLKNPSHEIKYVRYFTTLQRNERKKNRHRLYIQALESKGVQAVYGKFKTRTRRCFNGMGTCARDEEKETDVNIALTMYRLASRNECSAILLISGDSDQVPAIKLTKADFPHINIAVAIPPFRKSEELQMCADRFQVIDHSLLHSCQLPQMVKIGNKAIHRPPEWR